MIYVLFFLFLSLRLFHDQYYHFSVHCTKNLHSSDGLLRVVLKTCASNLVYCLGTLFSLCLPTSTISSCKKRSFSRCLKEEIYLILQLLSCCSNFWFLFVKIFVSVLTSIFRNNFILLILFLIANIAFVRNARLIIFFPFSLTIALFLWILTHGMHLIRYLCFLP